MNGVIHRLFQPVGWRRTSRLAGIACIVCLSTGSARGADEKKVTPAPQASPAALRFVDGPPQPVILRDDAAFKARNLGTWGILVTQVGVVEFASAADRRGGNDPSSRGRDSIHDALRVVYTDAKGNLAPPRQRIPSSNESKSRPLLYWRSGPHEKEPGQWVQRYYVYGRTAEEARRLVRALVGHVAQTAASTRQRWEQRRERNQQEIRRLRAELPKLEAELEEAKAFLEAHPSNPQHAEDLAAEFDKQLRLLRIEIAGLEAQRRAAAALGGAGGSAAIAALQQKLDVELAGALARREAITTELNGAQKELRRQALATELPSKRKQLVKNEAAEADFQRTAADPPANWTPPAVVDNTVTIVTFSGG